MGGHVYTDNELQAIAGWLKEKLSASHIAARLTEMGVFVSRNAVVGIVNRNKALKAIGLQGRTIAVPKQPKPASKATKPVVRQASVALVRREAKPAPAPRPRKPIPLLKIQSGQCRYPVSEDRSVTGLHLFCAAPVADGSSWCEAHRLICSGVGTFPERAAGRVLARAAA